MASSYANTGQLYSDLSDYSKALDFLKKIWKSREEALFESHPDSTISYDNIGGVYYDMSQHSKTLKFYKKSIEIRKKSLPSNHLNMANCFNNLVQVYRQIGDYRKTIKFCKRRPKNHTECIAFDLSEFGHVLQQNQPSS